MTEQDVARRAERTVTGRAGVEDGNEDGYESGTRRAYGSVSTSRIAGQYRQTSR